MTVDSVVPSLPLRTGGKQPLLGLGTWSALDAEELRVALRAAFDIGYRSIDTAEQYQNEHVVGEVLAEYIAAGKLRREDVFITTKLPFYSMHPEEAEECIKKQLNTLGVDYIDLYLIHCPFPLKIKGGCYRNLTIGTFIHEEVPHIDTWRVLEKFHKSGQLKAIGVSNFNARQLQALYDQAEVKPANLQIEAHIYWPQHELQALCSKLGMTVTAYAPIGSPGRVAFRPHDHWPVGAPMDEPHVIELTKKYGKTPAQILLRHLIQRGIAVIPKSTNEKRLRENFAIFDFELSPEDQQVLLDVKTRVRLFEMRFAADNKQYPYDDVDHSNVFNIHESF